MYKQFKTSIDRETTVWILFSHKGMKGIPIYNYKTEWDSSGINIALFSSN